MDIEEQIEKATCRVDAGNIQLGTAFWVDCERLITAAHVVEEIEDDTVTLQDAEGTSFEARVEYSDPNTVDKSGTDLALLSTKAAASDGGLSLDSEVPSIGTELVWSGYARLFGESKIDRQRFGWGRVASREYEIGRGTFYEVDGLFNPSHSGGPVVDKETGEVVGVVSASAGEFDQLIDKWLERVRVLQGLFDLAKGGGMLYRNYSYDNPEDALHDKTVFEDLGLNVDMESDDDGSITLRINMEEIPIQAGQVQAEISELLLETAQQTFQMGVGIASGGDVLDDFIS